MSPLPKRTHTCGQLRAHDDGAEVVLDGWVAAHRDLGGLTFLQLRDRHGVTQVVLADQRDESGALAPGDIRVETVLSVRGTVRTRPEDQRKGDGTGAIEVVASSWRQLAPCAPLPFDLGMHTASHEETRLAHRYLDLRRPELMGNLVLRHRATQLVRRHLDDAGFLEVETPTLTRSTPEGARDYLVPSRVHRGRFFALPQSPQLFKQLLMIAGVDRYMQIVRCYRDEDLRADRQPEFTQLDLEMSFVDRDDVMALAESLVTRLWGELLGVRLETPFPRITHREALERWGTDKPDLRFGMELLDATALDGVRFDFVREAIEGGGRLLGLAVPGGAAMSRKQLDGWTARARQLGLGGLLWAKVADGGWTGPAAKGCAPELQEALNERLPAAPGDLVLLAVAEGDVVRTAMDRLRREIAARRDLIPGDTFSFCWVVDFPLVEYDAEAGRHVAVHHPFTAPLAGDLHLLDEDPAAVRSDAYDLVCNGVELGGGSIRIHDPELQDRMFAALGIDAAEAADKFGFLREALRYGAPPHGGIAFGLDRMVAMLAGTEAIRDVIAFPKTTSSACPLTSAPAAVDAAQLAELHLAITGDDAGDGGPGSPPAGARR